MGWRYLMFCLGGITLGVFLLRFLVFKFRESPQFLLSRGRDAEAIEVVRAIARMNGARPPNLSLEDFGAVAALLGEEDAHAAEIISAARKEKLTHTQMLRKTSQETYVHLKRIKIIFSTFTMGRVTLIIWLTFIAGECPIPGQSEEMSSVGRCWSVQSLVRS